MSCNSQGLRQEGYDSVCVCTVKMEGEGSSETLPHSYQTIPLHIPEDSNVHKSVYFVARSGTDF